MLYSCINAGFELAIRLCNQHTHKKCISPDMNYWKSDPPYFHTEICGTDIHSPSGQDCCCYYLTPRYQPQII